MKYLITMKDGSVAIMETIGDFHPTDCIEKWHESEKEKVQSVKIIEDENIPADRYFRDAWVSIDEKINIDMSKAKEVHLNNLRVVRNKKLQELDVELMRALEKGDSQATSVIAEKKQKLRDITKHERIDNAKTAEELKGVTLDLLTQ